MIAVSKSRMLQIMNRNGSFRRLYILCLVFTLPFAAVAYQSPIKQWSQDLQMGYRRRITADPAFKVKSITEVLLAAGTQLTAEWNRRGTARLLPEIDFVVPGILTAVFGKYYR